MYCEAAIEGNKRVEKDWKSVDRALRSIAKRRAELDAEEARWLREAEVLQIWRPLGMVSMLDYLERVLGYAPRKAQERLRVARALGALPQLSAALAGGELALSAVRELTRVVTPVTEAAWIEHARGKNLREIEESTSHRRAGAKPGDPPDPQPRRHVVRFELSPETFAALRQARMVLNDEHAQNLTDDQFIAAMCHAVLDGASTAEPTGRAKFQIALTVCERCGTGWQEGAGAQIVVGPAAVERAMCDAQHIGSIDGDGPERAFQDVPPSVVRFVWRRDGGRCRVPGCRSARGLEVHHIVHRADGGTHEPSGLVLLCSACHQAHHAGVLAISGTAEYLEVRRPTIEPVAGGRRAHVGVRSELVQPGDRTDAAVANAAPFVGTERRAHVGVRREEAGRLFDDADPFGGTERRAHVGVRREEAGRLFDEGAVERGEPRPRHVISHDDRSDVAVSSRLAAAVLRTQAKQALVGMGWKPAIASAALAEAWVSVGAEASLEEVVFAALRRCPRPTSA